MPEPLEIEGDQRFFEHGLDQVDVVVHGALFAGANARSSSRRRLILTTRVPCIAFDPANARTL